MIAEFLEVAFHQILHIRKVYPPDLFEQRKKFNVPLFSSRHPLLSSYIAEIISQSIEEVSKGLVNKLILAIQDNSTLPPSLLEQFVFNLQYLIDPLTTFDTEADRNIRPIAAYGTKADAELHIRAFLIKLNTCQHYLGEATKTDLTWTTFLELNDPSQEPFSETSRKKDLPPQWIPAENPTRGLQNESSPIIKQKDFAFPSSKDQSKRLIPLKTEGLGMIQLQMLVIQHQRQGESRSDT